MTYVLQEQYTSKNQVPGASADSVWHLGPRKVSSITIHHWGNKGQQFDTVRDFLCTNDTPTSAHYVAQDGLVACIVSPDDCAFHAGNPEGNTNSVGIECRPEATDGDYATVAELIRTLRGLYGDVPLYPHNHWFNTACPGDYDLGRLDAMARSGAISAQSSTITVLEDTLSAAEVTTITDAINFAFGRIKQEIPADTAAAVLACQVPHKDPVTGADDGQTTSLATVAGFTDFQHNSTRTSLPAAVLNQGFTLPDGTVTNLAGILGAINAKPAGTTNVTGADPSVVVAAIKAQWAK